MILTEQNVAFYLMDKGYLPVKQFVDGDFRVDVSDSRNRNFIVNRDYDNACFIKHVRQFDAEKTSTLRTEATCYWLANHDANYANLKSFLPAYHSFDYVNYILVLGLEKGTVSVFDFYSQKGMLFPSVSRQLGVLLSTYHKEQSSGATDNKAKKFFKKMKPWVFYLGDSDRFGNDESNKAQTQVIGLVRGNQQYKEMIRGLENQWVYTSLIHNDIKFHNLLIDADHTEGTDPALRLIDWELADIGDPCWDVAALLQSYLTLWVMYETNSKQGQDFSLPGIQQSLKQFWEAYVSGMEMNRETSDEQLLKCIHYCALKLIHTSIETTTGAQSLSPYGARLLQLSFNILKSAKEARYNLLGIQ